MYSKKILNIFKKYYLEEKINNSNINEVREFFDMLEKKKYTIDEQCFYDLDMENVFHKVDRTSSSVGEAVLYKIMREPIMNEEALKKRSKVIDKIVEDKDLRAKLQCIFYELGFDKKNRFLEMMKKEFKSNKLKRDLYTLFGIVNFILIILTFATFNKYIAFSVLILFIIAPSIEAKERKNVSTNGLVYLSAMLNAAIKIVALDKKENLGGKRIKELLNSLRDIRKNTFLISLSSMYGGILEPFLLPFLIVEGSYYRVVDKLREQKDELLELYYELGKIEAYISVGIYKEVVKENISEPIFINETKLNIVDGIHPLLKNPVENSIIIDKKGIVLTGTNMSGKSTFLRMVGINAIFAQIFNFTLSSRYEASFFNVVTSISPNDDVNNGKSYYLAEVEAIHRIINSLEGFVRSLCIIDEIFRGTNPIERISSSTAILNYINKRDAITFVATHDKELTDLLKNKYDFYYFSENVDNKEGLSFDYKLKSGVVKSRNAIRLLDYMGYPKEIVNEAMSLTSIIEKNI